MYEVCRAVTTAALWECSFPIGSSGKQWMQLIAMLSVLHLNISFYLGARHLCRFPVAFPVRRHDLQIVSRTHQVVSSTSVPEGLSCKKEGHFLHQKV